MNDECCRVVMLLCCYVVIAAQLLLFDAVVTVVTVEVLQIAECRILQFEPAKSEIAAIVE